MWWRRRARTGWSLSWNGPRIVRPKRLTWCEPARRRKLCGAKCDLAIYCGRAFAVVEMFLPLEEGRFVKMIAQECNESACDEDDDRPGDDTKYFPMEVGIDEEPYRLVQETAEGIVKDV